MQKCITLKHNHFLEPINVQLQNVKTLKSFLPIEICPCSLQLQGLDLSENYMYESVGCEQHI